MRVSFTANTEDSSKYDYVECTFHEGNTVKLGVAGKNLNYSKIVWKPLQWGEPLQQDYTIRVSFNKVSKKTDLSYVSSKMGVKLTALAYGMANKAAVYKLENVVMDGWFLTREEVKAAGAEQPVYAYLRLDTFNDKAKCYYMLPSNEEQKEIEFTYTFVEQGIGEYHLTDSKGGVWILSNNQLSYMVPNAGEAGNQTMEWKFGWTASLDYDLTETIAANMDAYEEDKCWFKGHEWSMDASMNLCEYKKICDVCGLQEGTNKEHVYDDDNDATCNVCGYERIVEVDICPDFTVDLIALENGVFTSSDKTFTLSENRGKITVINLWATWCGPCINEIPEFDEFKKAYPEVDIIAIAAMDDYLLPWMNDKAYQNTTPDADWTEYSIDFATYDEAEEDLYVKLGGDGMYPFTIIVDESGAIVYQKAGALTYESLETLIKPLLNK